MAKGTVLVGLLAGAAAGAIAGVLLAPGKGSETRKNLSNRSRETVDNLKGKVNDFVDTVADKYLSGNDTQGGSSRDGGLDRTHSTASHLNPGTPGTHSFS